MIWRCGFAAVGVRRSVPVRNDVRVLREQMRLTQVDLARRVGVSRQTIIAIERERFDASLPLAFRLAGALGTTVDELFFADDDIVSPSV